MDWLNSWQSDYEEATGNTGKVKDVYGRIGRFGGLAIWVEVKEGSSIVYYSPYLNSSPYDYCPAEDGSCFDSLEDEYDWYCAGHEFELDEGAWIDSMTGATCWGEWDWGEASKHMLEH